MWAAWSATLVYVRPSSGPEHVLLAKDLLKGAAAADVSLVVLLTAFTPRQPGGRNWLWQKVGVRGLEEALGNARMADFLNALGSPSRRLAVVALPQGQRTALDLQPAGDLPSAAPPRPVAELLANAVSDLTGKVTATSMLASVRSATYQQELDHRLLPGIPSEVQIGYGLLIVLGLLGVPVARVWWQRVWPPEQADDYAGHTGYWAARAVRGLAFGLLFVPLTAPVSTPYSLGRQVREAVTAPARLWRRRPSAGPAEEHADLAPRARRGRYRPGCGGGAEDDRRWRPQSQSRGVRRADRGSTQVPEPALIASQPVAGPRRNPNAGVPAKGEETPE